MSEGPTELQELLGHNILGEYERSFMIRRLSQMALLADRDISMAQLAKKLEISREAMRLYFLGRLWTGRDVVDGLESPRAEKARDENEDRVERAIEEISTEIGFELPPAIDYIPELLIQDLMKAPA
jgi:transcriptional regulator GlxA family with amidase domain